MPYTEWEAQGGSLRSKCGVFGASGGLAAFGRKGINLEAAMMEIGEWHLRIEKKQGSEKIPKQERDKERENEIRQLNEKTFSEKHDSQGGARGIPATNVGNYASAGTSKKEERKD